MVASSRRAPAARWLSVLAALAILFTTGSLRAGEPESEDEWWKLSENARGAAFCAGVFRQLGRPDDERFYVRLGQASDLYEPHVGVATLRLQIRDGAWDHYLVADVRKRQPELAREIGLAFLEGADSLLRQPRAASDEIQRARNALHMIPEIDRSLVPAARAWAIRAARAVLSPRTAPYAKELVLVLGSDRTDPDVTDFLFRSARDLLDAGASNEAAAYAQAGWWMGRSDRTTCEIPAALRDVGMALLAADDEDDARENLSWAVGLDPSLETDDVFWARHVTLSCRKEAGARSYLERFPAGTHRVRARSLIAEAAASRCAGPFSVLDPTPGLTPPRVIETTPVFVPSGQSSFGHFYDGPRVRVTVDACGTVRDVAPVGWSDARVIEAAWCSRFEPARVDGQPVAATTVVEIPVMELARVTSLDDRRIYPGMEIPVAVAEESSPEELARQAWKCTTFDRSLFPQPIYNFGSNWNIDAVYPILPEELTGRVHRVIGKPCIEFSMWKLILAADGLVESAVLREAFFTGQQVTGEAMEAEEKRYGTAVRSLRYTPFLLHGQPVRSRTNLGILRQCDD